MSIQKPFGVKVIVIGIFLVGGLVGCNQPDVYEKYFIKYYGEQGSQVAADMVIDESDMTLILLGTNSTDQKSELYLVKVQYDGNVIWKKKLGGPSDVAVDIELSNDGGFVILSQTLGVGGEDADIKITKITTEGQVLDSVLYGTPQRPEGGYANEFPSTITAIGDGYLVTGSTDFDTIRITGAPNLSDVMHFKFSETLDFDPTFTPIHSDSETELGVKSIELAEGKYYFFGSSYKSQASAQNDDFNFWFVEIDDNGLATGKGVGVFGNDQIGNDEVLRAICPAHNSGFFLVGSYTTINNPTISDLYIATVFEDGGELKKAFGDKRLAIPGDLGGNRFLRPVAVCPSFSTQLGYLILCNEGDVNFSNIWLTKVNELGNVLWSSSFGALGGNHDIAGSVVETSKGEIFVLGTVNLGDESIQKMALFKLNEYGRLAE